MEEEIDKHSKNITENLLDLKILGTFDLIQILTSQKCSKISLILLNKNMKML